VARPRTSKVIVLGAGGHAQVVADILLRAHEAGSSRRPVGYLDDDPELEGSVLLGLPVLGAIGQLDEFEHDAVIVGMGDNGARADLFSRLRARAETIVSAIHPSAVVAPDVSVGQGVMICAGSVVNTGAVIGDNVILNTGCTVDHGDRIGASAHVAPGAHLGGEVTVGQGALIGIGSIVVRGCRIGEWAVIGAGSVVTKDIPCFATAVGVPARVIKRDTPER